MSSTFPSSSHQKQKAIGFRFNPTDKQLIDYLRAKVHSHGGSYLLLPELDVYTYKPWNLYMKFEYAMKDEFYCFTRVERSKAVDQRLPRSVKQGGNWTANGQPVEIKSDDGKIIGRRQGLKFYTEDHTGKKGQKKNIKNGTGWVMREYRLDEIVSPKESKYETVLCRISPSGKGPLDDNGEQEEEAVESPCKKQKRPMPVQVPLRVGSHSGADPDEIVKEYEYSYNQPISVLSPLGNQDWMPAVEDDSLGLPSCDKFDRKDHDRMLAIHKSSETQISNMYPYEYNRGYMVSRREL